MTNAEHEHGEDAEPRRGSRPTPRASSAAACADGGHLGGDRPRGRGGGVATPWRPGAADEGGEVVERRSASASGSSTAHVRRPSASLPRRLEVELARRASGGSSPSSTSTTITVMLSRPPWRLASGDQLVGGGLRVGDRREHDLADLVVADLVDEPVAAQQEAVAAHDRQRPRVDADRRVDAEGPGDDVAAGVGAGLVVGDVAGGDELLHVAVVDGDPAQPAVAQQVGARVADVDEGEAARRRRGVGGPSAVGVAVGGRRDGDDEQAGDRGAHALLVGVGGGGAVKISPLASAIAATTSSRSTPGVAEAALQQVDGEGAGHLAGPVPAHPVGDGEHAVGSARRLSSFCRAGSRPGSVAAPQRSVGHYCASSTV